MATQTEKPRPDLSHLRIDEGARPSRRLGKRLAPVSALLGALVILAGITVAILKSRSPAVEVATAQSPVADPRSSAVLNASGYVTPRRRATVAAKITGRVVAVYAEEGMHAGEGQVLARLDESDARVRLDSARSDRDASQAAIADLEVRLANAERELRRTDQLQAAGIATVQAQDLARTTAESLRAQLALAHTQVTAADARIAVARQDLDNATIRAPFNGIIVSKDAQIGEIVSPVSAGGGFTRTGIATMVDMNSIEVEVDVNESYIARVLPGQPAIATLDAYPDWQIPAKVRTVIPTADRQKATVKVRLSFDKLDPRILPDMGVKVAFLANETHAAREEPASTVKALIPEAAIRSENGQSVVLVVANGRIERRAVSIAGRRDGQVQILAGVASGDQVVTAGPSTLHDGEPVHIKR
jgi:RND family efflux transporter MFP subunit